MRRGFFGGTRPIQKEPTGSKGWMSTRVARQNFLRHTWLYNLEPLQETESSEKSMFSFRSDDVPYVPYVHCFGWNGGVAKMFWGEVCFLFCCLGDRI